MKKLARNQTSNRNTSTAAKTIVKTKRRGGVKSKHRKAGSTTYTVKGWGMLATSASPCSAEPRSARTI